MAVVIENPVLNSPFAEPEKHFRFDEEGITDEIVEERRLSTYFVPIAPPKKRTFAGLLGLRSCSRPSKIVNPTRKQLMTGTANFGLIADDENRLTDWMVANLFVRAGTSKWIPLETLERAVGALLRPPLDQERTPMWLPNPWRRQVSAARERLRLAARAVAGIDDRA